MAEVAGNVNVFAGIVSYAAAGATLPTAWDSALSGFDDVGFIDENGVTQTISQDTNEIKAWGGSVVRKVQTSHTVEYKFAMLESNETSLAAYYGTDNVDATNAVVEVTALMNQRGAWVIDVEDGIYVVRLVIPDGEATGHEDVPLDGQNATKYGLTITAYADSSLVKCYQYFHTNVFS